jgi:small GTP-binding protein
VQYVQSVFVEKYDPTIEDSYRKVVEREKDNLSLDILDTAGTEQFTAMRDMYMKNGDAFLLVYSVTSPATLHDLLALRERLARVKPAAKIVLVGNKADLAADRSVSKAQGEAMAGKWGCPFVETSAKDAASVQRAFSLLIEELEKPSGNGNGLVNGSSNGNTVNNNGSFSDGGKKKKKCIIA